MNNRITDQDSGRIKILAATGKYTPQEISTEFKDKYSPNQIIRHLKLKDPESHKMLRRETSRGGVKLKAILTKLYPNIKIEEEFHVGERLRLDFYIAEPYNLGFEFDGIQHSKYTPGLHKDEDHFYEGKSKDIAKELLCIGRGINLIRVDYSEDLTLELLLEKIKEAGHGTGIIQGGFSTNKECFALKERHMRQAAARYKKEQREVYKQSESYKLAKEKQKEYQKEQYKRKKEWLKKQKK